MDVEIITIGDELITGFTLDTNGAFLSRRLTQAGFTVRYRSSVGDAPEEMEAVFRQALKRAKIVITTGGLGPTDDDITKRVIVKVFKRNLVFHEDILEDIKQRFARRGIEMPAINQNQALLPQGATFFPNKFGSAVGICIAEHGRIFISLPGVPREMEQITDDQVLPYLEKSSDGHAIKIVSLRTTGVVETRLAEIIKPNLRLEQGVRLAYLPAYSGITLRVIATGENAAEAEEKASGLVRYLENTAGKYVFGRDDDTLEGVVGQLLADNDKTLAVAESCTGGQLGMTITSVSGASRYFKGGVLTYSNEVKTEQLGVSSEILERDGAVSEACAVAMAVGCRKLFGSDYALSVTGIAGPDGGSDDKPVGTTYIGLASAHTASARRFNFGADRKTNRSRAVYAALEMLRREILDIV